MSVARARHPPVVRSRISGGKFGKRGLPLVTAVAGTPGRLGGLRASAAASAAPYDDANWCARWAAFVADSGYDVTGRVSMADVVIAGSASAADVDIRHGSRERL